MNAVNNTPVVVDQRLVRRAVRSDLRRYVLRLRELRAHTTVVAPARRQATLDVIRTQTELADCRSIGFRVRLMRGSTELVCHDCPTHIIALRHWSRLIRYVETHAHREARKLRITPPDHLYVISWVNRWYGAMDSRRTTRVRTEALSGLHLECAPID